MLARLVGGFVLLHIVEDLCLLTMGRFLGPLIPLWAFYPAGILFSAVVFSLFVKRVVQRVRTD
jgi:hypothetical protein